MKYKSKLKENDVTDESLFLNRRKVLKNLGFVGAAVALPTASMNAKAWFDSQSSGESTNNAQALAYAAASQYTQSNLTPESNVIGYNNFYEFGFDKSDPARFQNKFKSDPWSVKIDGEVSKPMTLDLHDLYSRFNLEERIYRFRCVEAWSMVIPWIGFSLSDLIKLVEPTSDAKYVAFETLFDPAQFPTQNGRPFGGFSFPYIEGLRMDEAMHPLTFLSVGLYGKKLLPQNGAPIRLVVPWKYGFKSIKSIVRIRFTKEQPQTTWNLSAPHEYGFYANVNPNVAHPRWSQASERIIGGGSFLSASRQDTQLFNGYNEVASLYANMNLKENF